MRLTENQLRHVIRQELIREFNLAGAIGKGISAIGGGIIEKIKESIARKIMRLFGVDTNGFMAKVVINAMGNLEIGEMWDMAFGDERLELFVKELLEAMEETLIESIPELFGVQPQGKMHAILREALINSFVQDNEATQRIADVIAKEIKGAF